MGPQDKALPLVVLSPVFRKAASHAEQEQEAHEPMRNFDTKKWILEK